MQTNLHVQDNQGPSKSDEEFFPYEERLEHFKWLKRFAFAVFPLGIYQVISGFILGSIYSTSFNLSLGFIGLFSLVLIGLVLARINSIERSEAKLNNAFTEKRDGASATLLFMGALTKFGQTLWLIINIIFQKDYISDYLNANQSTQQDAFESTNLSQVFSSSALLYMTMIYGLCDILISIHALFGLKTSFRLTLNPRKLTSLAIFILNSALLCASLMLVYSINQLWSLDSTARLESLFPKSFLHNLSILGIVSASLTLPIWLVNHKKWRIGFLTFSLITAFISFLSLGFTGLAYSHSKAVYDFYRSTDNSEWKFHMGFISQNEVERNGCSAKYLHAEACKDSNEFLIQSWEITENQGMQTYCINKQCSGILAQIYTKQYLGPTNWALVCGLLNSFIAIALTYSMKTRGGRNNEQTKASKNHYKWLLLLGTLGISSIIISGIMPNPKIEEFNINQTVLGSSALSMWDL